MRFVVEWSDRQPGQVVPVRLSVNIYLDVQPLRAELAGQLAGEALDGAVDRWRRQTIEVTTRAVQEMVNVGHRLPDGSPVRLAVDFVDTPADAHHMVVLRASGRMNSGTLGDRPSRGRPTCTRCCTCSGRGTSTASGPRAVAGSFTTTAGSWPARSPDGSAFRAPMQDRPYPDAGLRVDVRLMPRDLRRLAAGVLRAIDGPVDGSVQRSVAAPAVVFAEGVLQDTLSARTARIAGTGRRTPTGRWPRSGPWGVVAQRGVPLGCSPRPYP